MNNRLSVVIPIKNEESNLNDCLISLGKDFAEEVIILDSNSSDNSLKIAQSFHTKIIEFNWNGKYPKKRNWFLLNEPSTTEWVLFLDADERLNDKVKKEIKDKIQSNKYEGFWINYTNSLNGKMLKGGYPLKKIALFKRSKYLYERIEENNWSNLDMEIHEHPIIYGKIGIINAPISHQINDSLKKLWRKHIAYAQWEANRFKTLEKGKLKLSMTKNQRIKYKLMNFGILPEIYFLGAYIFLLGFLDGKQGIVYAKMKYRYFKLVQELVKQKKFG
jgi:glycosyltransferase involved in cell wall biosynthesis